MTPRQDVRQKGGLDDPKMGIYTNGTELYDLRMYPGIRKGGCLSVLRYHFSTLDYTGTC